MIFCRETSLKIAESERELHTMAQILSLFYFPYFVLFCVFLFGIARLHTPTDRVDN